jgi:hypothetical protein
MKTILTTLMSILVVLQFAFAQQVARDHVVVEVGTGFW